MDDVLMNQMLRAIRHIHHPQAEVAVKFNYVRQVEEYAYAVYSASYMRGILVARRVEDVPIEWWIKNIQQVTPVRNMIPTGSPYILPVTQYNPVTERFESTFANINLYTRFWVSREHTYYDMQTKLDWQWLEQYPRDEQGYYENVSTFPLPTW